MNRIAEQPYVELKRRIQAAGLLRRRPAAYLPRLLLNVALLAVGILVLVASESAVVRLLDAAFVGFACVQAGFIVHDAGHRQIFASKRANDAMGRVHANLFLGLSYGWWVEKHDRHHGNPNDPELDPDLDIPLLAFSAAQARAKRGLARAVARYQAYLFYPLLTFEALHLRMRTFQFLLGQRGAHRALESALVGASAVLYAALLLSTMDLPLALAFAFIQHAVAGVYLGSVFAPNHKGMLLLDARSDLDFLRRQVLTSRNVRGGRITDFVYGGLNYQVEHHLFPTMPRGNLAAAQRIVRAFCDERGIPYYEVGPVAATREILGYLHGVSSTLGGRSVRALPSAS